jgi:hypothetical protein
VYILRAAAAGKRRKRKEKEKEKEISKKLPQINTRLLYGAQFKFRPGGLTLNLALV